MQGFKLSKAVQALNYFAVKSKGNLNKMKALKLIWLSDRYHLRRYGRTITGDVYFALPFGPVASTTRDILEGSSSLSDGELSYSNDYIESTSKYNYKSKGELDAKVFSKTDIEVLDLIFSKYQELDQFQLSDLSHSFPEWKKYQSAIEQGIASRFEIDWNDFFANVDDGKGLFLDDEEFLAISKEMFCQ